MNGKPVLPGSGQSMQPDPSNPFPELHSSGEPVPSSWQSLARLTALLIQLWIVDPKEALVVEAFAREKLAKAQMGK